MEKGVPGEVAKEEQLLQCLDGLAGTFLARRGVWEPAGKPRSFPFPGPLWLLLPHCLLLTLHNQLACTKGKPSLVVSPICPLFPVLRKKDQKSIGTVGHTVSEEGTRGGGQSKPGEK